MKKLLLILTKILAAVSLTHATANAEVGGIRSLSIPQGQLEYYKKAVSLALQKKHVKCLYISNIYTLINSIRESDSAVLTDAGNHLVLTFNKTDQANQEIFTVISSSDYKTIQSVDVEKFELVDGEVNTGDLLKPVIISKSNWQSSFKDHCASR